MIDRGRNRRGDHRGAALIELALVLPLIVMLVVGMVSAGIAYNRQLSLTHAAREGGRYAATLPVSNFGSIDDWLADVINQVVDDATGSLDAGVPGRFICVAYVYPDGLGPPAFPNDQTTSRILDSSGLEPAGVVGRECFAASDGRPDNERRVQVVVGRDSEFNALVFSATLNLDEEAVSRFEAS